MGNLRPSSPPSAAYPPSPPSAAVGAPRAAPPAAGAARGVSSSPGQGPPSKPRLAQYAMPHEPPPPHAAHATHAAPARSQAIRSPGRSPGAVARHAIDVAAARQSGLTAALDGSGGDWLS
jgi:hypothetical protein